MAAHKFLKLGASGFPIEESAVATSAGAGDEGKIPALDANGVLAASIVNSKTTSAGAGDANKIPALDVTGRLDSSFLPSGIGADTASITASEDLAAGDLVNIYDATGAKVRKADGSTIGKDAHGFVLAGVLNLAAAVVYFEGTNAQVTGLTPGPQFLSATPGLCTATPPAGTGKTVQNVGVATSATSMNFERGTPYGLA